MIKKIVILLGIIQSILCYASEKNNEPVPFTKIKSTKDIKVFSEKIIAYRTPVTDFKGSTFKDEKGKQYFYGYITISDTDEQCYVLFKVIKGIGNHKACVLTNEKIDGLYVREAIPGESNELKQGFQKNILTFPYNALPAEKAMNQFIYNANK